MNITTYAIFGSCARFVVIRAKLEAPRLVGLGLAILACLDPAQMTVRNRAALTVRQS
jgi:hypothetical protein